MRLIALSVILLASSCAPEEPVNHYQPTGVIVRLDAKIQVATIAHEAILDEQGKLWMEAMTMDFPVKDAREFSLLKAGLKIQARVSQRPSDYEYWIDRISVQSTQ